MEKQEDRKWDTKKSYKTFWKQPKMVILGSSLSVLTLNGNRFNSLIQKIQMSWMD